jgi:hypothetical protein
MRDEGGPFGTGSQVQVSSHRKLLPSKAVVVSVAETPGQRSRQARLREASASEPPMKCRKQSRRCRNRGLTRLPGSAWGNPEACPGGIRHVGGAKLNQAPIRNGRNSAPMRREKPQAAETVRAKVPMRSPRDGAARSSGEGPVMLCHERWRVYLATCNYAKDGGRPSGFGGQALFPNHRKLLRSKAVVVSVTEKMGR